jgi:enoyl-CoA hydratase
VSVYLEHRSGTVLRYSSGRRRDKREITVDEQVTYRQDDGLAEVTMDDGKVNAVSPTLIAALHQALDRAEADAAAVLLSGRPGVFSAGFDLGVMRAGGAAAVDLVHGGFELAARMLAFPHPIVVASTGHAVAMGLFLVQSADYRVGTAGPFKYQANEVAIGLTVPRAAVEILRQRLAPAHFQRVAILSEPYTPDGAVTAGMLDTVVEADALSDTAQAAVRAALALDRDAHTATKQRVRAQSLAALRAAIEIDHEEARGFLAATP